MISLVYCENLLWQWFLSLRVDSEALEDGEIPMPELCIGNREKDNHIWLPASAAINLATVLTEALKHEGEGDIITNCLSAIYYGDEVILRYYDDQIILPEIVARKIVEAEDRYSFFMEYYGDEDVFRKIFANLVVGNFYNSNFGNDPLDKIPEYIAKNLNAVKKQLASLCYSLDVRDRHRKLSAEMELMKLTRIDYLYDKQFYMLLCSIVDKNLCNVAF